MKFSEMPYTRLDMDQIQQEFSAISNAFDTAASGAEQFTVHQRYYTLTDHILTQMTIARIRHHVDMTDPFYAKENDYYDEIIPVMQNLEVAYQKKLFRSRFRPELEKIIGPVAFKNIELAMKSVDPRILPLMQEENRLESEYNKLLASAKIPWGDEQLNLSLMTPYLKNADRGIRKKAWTAYTAFFAEHMEEFDDFYDRLVKNRTAQAEALGYKNYLTLGDFRMMRNCYTRDDMYRFRKQVKSDLVPFTQELHERRRDRLGVSALSYIDEGVYFVNGNPSPVGTWQQILESGRKMYRELSAETGAFMDFMCDNELFDVLGRKTKKTGGYMTYLPDYNAPFIFANFNGTSGDIDVITHECGHAFQGYLSGKDPIREHADITMETAETHSMSMEFFTEPWMKEFFGPRTEDYVQMHFEDSVNFIPYGTMVDEFQDIAYTNPGLSPKERRQAWRDLERQYKPHLDYSGNEYLESGGFWQKQHHIFGHPLYYIDYCIASIDALQYKIWMDRDFTEAWKSYLKLCTLSASDFFTGLLPKVGIILPFEDGCMSYVVRKLKESV